MPTYEYACELCGHKMEAFQSILAERLVSCPECSEDGLKRLIGTGAGVIFKGTGFYQTDYKKTSEPKEKTSGESDTKVAATSGTSGETSAKSGNSSSTPAAAASSGKATSTE